MASPAAVLQILVTANTAQAVTGLRTVDAQAKRTAATTTASTNRMSSGFSKMASVAKTAIAGGVVYGLYSGVKAGIEFEKQMDAVGAVANASAKEMRKLEAQALRLGQSTAFSASEAAAAQEELAKGGLKTSDILGGALKSSLSLAAAGQLELATAAETTVNAMKLFDIRAKEAGKVADMFATAANTTTADVEDFAMALKQGGSAAKAAGYDLNDTMVILEALAEAGIKNSDAGTSMKTAFLQLLAPTDKQKKLAEQLNIEWVNQAGNLKSASGLSRELQGALGGMTNAQQAANLKLLAGTDGFRTLNALLDAGPAKLEKLAAANDKQGTAQEIAKKKIDNTAGSIEQLQGAWETLSISLFQKAQSPFRSIIDSMTEGLQDFTDVVTDKRLTADEKISKVLEMISDALKDAIPKIAAAAAKIGATIVEGIANAFWHGDVLTQLFIGAAAIKMFGGASVLTAFGWQGGLVIGAAVAAGVAYKLEKDNHIIGDALFGRKEVTFKDALQRWLGTVPDLNSDQLKGAITLYQSLGKISEKAIWRWVENGDITAEQGQRMIQVLERVSKQGGKALIALSHTHKWTGNVIATQTGLWADHLRGFSQKTLDLLDKVSKAFKDPLALAMQNAGEKVKDFTTSAAERLLDFAKDADKATDRTGKNFDKLGDKSKSLKEKVGANILGTASVVTHGLDVIINNTNKALKGFGVKKIAISLAGVGSAASGFGKGFQTGGVIVPGQGDGDKVPALLEPGEVVLNKKAVAAMGGAAKANSINSKIPRFAKGGVAGGLDFALGPYTVPPIQYAADHAGGNSHVHITGTTTPWVVAIGKQLQRMGMLVGEHPAFGGVAPPPSHSLTGGHYDALAIDVNDPSDNEPKSWVASIARILGGSGIAGAVAEKIARVILKGPDGPLKSIGQSALDKARDAANKYVASQAPSGVDVGVVGPGANIKNLPKSLEKYNHQWAYDSTDSIPPSAVKAMTRWQGLPSWFWKIAIGESNFQPGAVGHDPNGYSTGYGLFQETEPFANPYLRAVTGGLDFNDWLNPIINTMSARKHFDAASSQTPGTVGFPWYGTTGLQRGGIIQKFGKGGEAKKDKELHGSISGGKTDSAWRRFTRARKIADKLKKLLGPKGRIAKIDESIGIQETLAGLDSSPMGSELSKDELARQVAMNERLLEVLVRARKLARSGLAEMDFPKGMSTTALGKTQISGMRGTFNTYLSDLTGITGKGGRIFDTRVHLDALKHTAIGAGALSGMDISALRSVIEASRYGAFDGMFAKGGSIRRGHWGIAGEAGPEIVHGPATVTPLSGGVNIQTSIDFDGLDAIVTHTVNGQIAKRERHHHRQARSYA